MYKVLRITDGTTYASGHRREVNLLSEKTGFCLSEWRPRVTEPKGGGMWSDSALADGRRLEVTHDQNVAETFTLEVRDYDADALIRETRALRQLLEKARAYWTTRWATEPVWIEAQGVNESEMRYSLVMDYRTPEDGNPYAEPFWQRIRQAGIDEFDLVLEREPYWRDAEPGTGECLEIGAMQEWCPSYPLVFADIDGYVSLGTPAELEDLPDADFTIDAWIYVNSGGTATRYIFHKGSWTFSVALAGAAWFLRAWADFATTDAESISAFNALPEDEWIHVAATWDLSDMEFTLYIDGEDVTDTQTAGVGAYQTDAAATAYIGNSDAGVSNDLYGEIGWLRLSTGERWTAEFWRPEQCILPNADTNTVWLGIYEGTPADPGVGDIHDLSGNGNDNTAAADVSWGECCTVYYGNYTPYFTRYMASNATTSVVDCGSDASIDDLANSDLTVEAWVRADGYGEAGAGIIATKQTAGGGWQLNLRQVATSLYCIVDCPTDSETEVLFVADSSWHHVAFVWNATTLIGRLFVDGLEPPYIQQTAGAGVPGFDSAVNLYIGNNSGTTQTFDGDIQWVRVSNIQRYSSNFPNDVPPRCQLPATDANTRGLWHYHSPTVIIDMSGNGNDGTPTAVGAGLDCTDVGGREETCDADTVYIANHHKQAQLTHLFYYSGAAAGYSPNLLAEVLPYPLLADAGSLSVSDALYAGIMDIGNSGPFCSLVFDLAVAGDGISFDNSGGTSFWQYWNGAAWGWLTHQDNTNADGDMTGQPLDTEGVCSLHWGQPSDWSVTTVNGVTGYWVRCVVSGVGVATIPEQQERQPYTISWPYVDVQSDKVGGDVPLLVRQYIRNQSDVAYSSVHGLWSTRVLCGLRTLSRGEDFSAYVNLASIQNATGVTVTEGTGGVFTEDTTTPVGYKLRCENAAATGTDVALIHIDADVADQYLGSYHVFVRGYQYSGTGTLEVELQGRFASAAPLSVLTDRVPFTRLIDWEVLDLGRLDIPWAGQLMPDSLNDIELYLYVYGDAASDCDLYNVIILPVDEWAIDALDTNISSTLLVGLGYRGGAAEEFGNTYLDIDSVSNCKSPIRSPLRYYSTDRIALPYMPISAGPAIAQANTAQRYWFLHVSDDTFRSIGSQPEVANSVQMWRVQRYLSMRGDS